MGEEEKSEREIELPQSIIESFARFLVPEIRKFYESEQDKRELAEWKAKRKEEEKNNERADKVCTLSALSLFINMQIHMGALTTVLYLGCRAINLSNLIQKTLMSFLIFPYCNPTPHMVY